MSPPDPRPPSDPGSPIDGLLFECLDRPESEWEAALEALCRAHPQQAETLRRRFALIAQLGPATAKLDPNLVDTVHGLPAAGHAPTFDLPGYEVGDLMGGGAMGVVYCGEHSATGTPVAIKVLHRHLVGSEGAQRRFRREAELAGRVDHPNLCGVLDAGILDGVPYLVMRRVDGVSLREWIPAQPWPATSRESTRRALVWGAQVAGGLDAIHQRGLVHRDVKPANIVVEEADAKQGGRAVLVDFGLAHEEGMDRFTATGEIVGSPAYLSPEALAGAPGDAAQDIYALGATLYEAVTGRLPFQAPTREALFRAVLTEPLAPTGLSDEWADLDLVLATALAKEPQQRYQSAALFASDLTALVEGRAVSVRAPGWAQRAKKWLGRNRVAAALVLVLGAGLGFSLYFLGQAMAARGRAEAQTLALASANAADEALAIRLARAALSRSDTAASRSALHRAVARFHGVAVGEVLGSPDSIRFADDRWEVRVGDRVFGFGGEALADAAPWVDPPNDFDTPDRGIDVFGMATSPDGELVATAEGDGVVRLWSNEGALLDEFYGHDAHVTCVAFDADARFLLSGDDSGCLRKWEVAPHGVRWSARSRIVAVARSAAGRILVATADGAVRVLDGSWRELASTAVEGLVGACWAGESIVCRDASGRVLVWSGVRAEPPSVLAAGDPEGRTESLRPAAASDVRIVAASGAGNASVLGWSLDGGEWRAMPAAETLPGAVTALAVAGQRTVVGFADGAVWLMGRAGTLRGSVGDRHTDWVRSIAIRGGEVATGSRDGQVKIWEVPSVVDSGSLRLSATLDPGGTVSAIAWSGERLATALSDGQIQLWQPASDVGRFELDANLSGHRAGVWSLLWTPAAGSAPGRLVSGAHDGTIREWWPGRDALVDQSKVLVGPARDEEVAEDFLRTLLGR